MTATENTLLSDHQNQPKTISASHIERKSQIKTEDHTPLVTSPEKRDKRKAHLQTKQQLLDSNTDSKSQIKTEGNVPLVPSLEKRLEKTHLQSKQQLLDTNTGPLKQPGGSDKGKI